MTQINAVVNPNVPDAYINIVTPTVPLVGEVQTDLIAVVGTASWGPVNAPASFSTPQDFQRNFGPYQPRKYDLGTACAAAMLQGAQNFAGVRVTDGTDTAASALLGIVTATSAVASGGASYTTSSVVTLSNGAVINVTTVSSGAITAFTVVTQPTSEVTGTGAVTQVSATGGGTGATFTFTYNSGLTLTSYYTGSAANGDTCTLSAGSAANTTKATITRSGRSPEVFDNISGSGNAFWVNLAAAINSGQSGLRGPSTLVVATAGTATVAPTNGVYTLAGGTDGTTTITAAVLIGSDAATPRTGMYALRGIGPHILVLADADSSTVWPNQVAFALQELGYAMLVGPAGEYTAPATVVSNLATAGIDSYAFKYLVGDWCYFLDNVNGGIVRMISPQGFAAGLLATLDPSQSGLNKQIQGILYTQKTLSKTKYAVADIAVFGAGRCDLITNPAPGGNYFALRQGRNGSSNFAINGDNYSRMNPYLAARIATLAGGVVGEVNTVSEQAEVTGAIDAGLYEDWQAGRISNPQGTQPYSVAIDNSKASLGYQIVNVNAQLGPIIAIFEVNLQAGQTVQIASQFKAAA